MKKLLILLLLVAASPSIMAQKVNGTFRPLKNQDRVKLVVDFSQGDILGMSEEQFSEYEEDWMKDKPMIVSEFYSYANRELNDAPTLGNYQYETPLVLTLFIRRVDSNGNYDCDVVLYENGTPIGSATGLRANGGRYGSKLNLMTDGAENMGKKLGKFLKTEMNRRK